MDTRPKPGEDEDDLLRLQAEFLSASKAKISGVNKRNADSDDETQKRLKKSEENNDPVHEEMDIEDNDTLLLDVVERDTMNTRISAPRKKLANQSFPEIVRIDGKLPPARGKSLFASQFASKKAQQSMDQTAEISAKAGKMTKKSFGIRSHVIDGSGLDCEDRATIIKAIHDENVKKLESMTEEDILQERQKLMKTLSPSLISFLQTRKKKSETDDPALKRETNQSMDFTADSPACNSSVGTAQDIKETKTYDESSLPIKPSEAKNWLHMDLVEHDKLAWMLPGSKTNSGEIQQGYAARFNFEGVLLPRSAEIPTHEGLHHHAGESDAAGYTLEEVLQYCRSSSKQQRILGLQTLTNIINKTKLGLYDECLDSSIIQKLLDVGVVLLIRWALDDTNEGTREAAVFALRALIVSDPDEICLDLVHSWRRGHETPFLKVEEDGANGGEKANEIEEMTDAELIKLDVIKGLLRTDLLMRFGYILEKHRPPALVVVAILEILIRIARHSLESSYSILKSTRVMKQIVSNFLPRHWSGVGTNPIDNAYGVPLPSAVKLIRVLATSGRNFATSLVKEYHVMDSLLRYIALDPADGTLPTREVLRLILESLSTWQIFMSYSVASHHYIDVFPLLMPQLQYYQQISVGSDHVANSYNYDHGATLFKLLETVVRVAASYYPLSTMKMSTTTKERAVLPPINYSHIKGTLQPVMLCARK